MPDEFSETLEQKRGRFLRWAAKANASAAQSSNPEERSEFLNIARSWKAMADAISQLPEK